MKQLAAQLALISVLGLAASAARAQGARWLDGTFGFEPGLACITSNLETEVTSYAGYWGTNTGSFPQTGDVSYVHGVAAVVGNPCSGSDAIGFDFELPEGAVLAISTENPVLCIATRLSDGFTTQTDPNIQCSQTATLGTRGGLFFGFAIVPSGWMFEIRVPVEFQKELLGIGGPAADQLRVATSSTNGVTLTEAWVFAPYRALVNYPAPSASFVGGTNYALRTFVYNYFKGGTADFELGTLPGNYEQGVVAPTPVPDTDTGFVVNALLTLTNYAGPIYWRTRFTTTSGGVYYGAEQSFTANGLTPAAYRLSVNKAGSGTGAVTSDPQGLNCGGSCELSLTSGTHVLLTAAADPGSEFLGFSGACAGASPCSVPMNAAAAVTATFGIATAPSAGSLDVTASGLPNGASANIAVSGPDGFSRVFTLLSGTAVSLSDVVPGAYVGVAADAASGADTYVARPASLAAAVAGGGRGVLSAEYQIGRLLTLTKAGSGTGSITSSPGGLSCAATCAVYFADTEQVSLNATPEVGTSFAGWSGACTGTGACAVTMNAPVNVIATFEPTPVGPTGPTEPPPTDPTAPPPADPNEPSPAGPNAPPPSDPNAPSTNPTEPRPPTDANEASPAGPGEPSAADPSASPSGTSQPTPGTATYSLSPALHAPADSGAGKGDAQIPMLAFDLTGVSGGRLASIGLSASGTGDDAADLALVELFVDDNDNGVVDPSERAIASGTFTTNDGSLLLTPPSAHELPGRVTHFLVTANLAKERAAGAAFALPSPRLPRPGASAFGLALALGVLLLGSRIRFDARAPGADRRGRPWLVAGLSLVVGACADAAGGGLGTATYTLSLENVTLTTSASTQSSSVAGLPLAGATLRVQR